MAITAGSAALASDFITVSSGATDEGKGVKLASDGKLDTSVLRSSFGGDGSDGALDTSTGAVEIDLNNAAIVIKNYSSINVVTNNVTFINPGANGTIVIFKSQGSVTISATIDLTGCGAEKGSEGLGLLDDDGDHAGNDGGGGAAVAGGSAYGITEFYTDSEYKLLRNTLFLVCGCGGGDGTDDNSGWYGGGGSGAGSKEAAGGAGSAVNGANGSPAAGQGAGGGGGGGDSDSSGTGGDGGRGGGALLIECAGYLNFSGTIIVAGQDGNNTSSSPAGAGGGGSAGTCIILYNNLTANTGTIDSSGGDGGDNTGSGYTGGAGGASYGGLVAKNYYF